MYKNVLVFYKRSAYEIYFLRKNTSKESLKTRNISFQIRKFKRAHDDHYTALKRVETIFKEHDLKYSKYVRGSKNIEFSKYDIIFTVGGDGTFLEAARNVEDQPVVGINSSPALSVGKLCSCTSDNFEETLIKILTKKIFFKSTARLELNCKTNKSPILFVNDILIAHKNPASISRYRLKIDKIQEDQKSSGLWVATPSGSTGAIHSAGAKPLTRSSNQFLYMPRELYHVDGIKYSLKGGILCSQSHLEVLSLMRNGMIYIDGSHFMLPFSIGDRLSIKISKMPLKTLI